LIAMEFAHRTEHATSSHSTVPGHARHAATAQNR
jgi:hypothetical protein